MCVTFINILIEDTQDKFIKIRVIIGLEIIKYHVIYDCPNFKNLVKKIHNYWLFVLKLKLLWYNLLFDNNF